jgi:hypothetical protein
MDEELDSTEELHNHRTSSKITEKDGTLVIHFFKQDVEIQNVTVPVTYVLPSKKYS